MFGECAIDLMKLNQHLFLKALKIHLWTFHVRSRHLLATNVWLALCAKRIGESETLYISLKCRLLSLFVTYFS
jgi:hypothetical protein